MSDLMLNEDRFSQQRLRDIADAHLLQGPETRRVLRLVSTNIEISALMTALILTREFASKSGTQEGDTLVAAAMLAGAANFDDVAHHVAGATNGIAHEVRLITHGDNVIPLHHVNNLSASAKRLFFAGTIASLEAAIPTATKGENGLSTLAELIRTASQAGDIERSLLLRTASAFNALSEKSGHKTFLTINGDKITIEVKVPPVKRWRKEEKHILAPRAPQPQRYA